MTTRRRADIDGDEPQERPAHERKPHWPRCAWTTEGRQCYLIGDISPDIGEGARRYCHWHYVSLKDPRFADDYEEFIRWLAVWGKCCSVENHYPPEMLWRALRGIEDLHGQPHVCKAPRCKHLYYGNGHVPF